MLAENKNLERKLNDVNDVDIWVDIPPTLSKKPSVSVVKLTAR